MVEVVVFRRPVLLSYCINGTDDLLEIERVVGREAMWPIGENCQAGKAELKMDWSAGKRLIY